MAIVINDSPDAPVETCVSENTVFGYIVTEDRDFIITEGGDELITENDPTPIPPSIAEKIGNGLRFDGVNQYAIVTGNSVLNRTLAQAYSLAFWFKTGSTIPLQVLSEFASIVGYAVSIDNTSAKVNFVIYNTGITGFWSKELNIATLSIDTLYHIVCTYDGSGSATGMKIYLNAVSDYRNRTIGTVTSATPSGNLNIGGRGATFNLKGILYDMAIFNSELSQSQINSIYNDNIYPAGEILRLKFEETTGSTPADLSGNGLITNLQNYTVGQTSLGAGNYHVDYLGNPIT